jgi:hypothetical protein
MRKCAFVATLAATAAAGVCAGPALAGGSQPLAEGPVKALPPGESFLSIIALPQPAGASLTHGHIPGFVYGLSGTATIVDEDTGTEHAVGVGEGHFISALAVHTHENADNRVQAGALAIGLVVGVIALLLVARSPRARVALVTGVLALLIAGGAVALWNPWTNDWFFIGVRPESARGGPMPTPSATRTYESPVFTTIPPGPYVESLATTTVDPQGSVSERSVPGPVVFLVLDGSAEVAVGNGEPVKLGHYDGTLVQTGESVRVVNPSGEDLKLLRFALTPAVG